MGFTWFYIAAQPSSIKVKKKNNNVLLLPLLLPQYRPVIVISKSPLLLCKPNGAETVVKFGTVPAQLLRKLQRGQGFRVAPRNGQCQTEVLLWTWRSTVVKAAALWSSYAVHRCIYS